MGLVIAGILIAALSLRGPIVAPTPVMRAIEGDLGIGSATSGLLTTVPVLMFAALTPLAALLIRRAGAEVALLLSLLGVLLGTAIRLLPGFGWLLTGMLVIGAAITVGNVVIPVIIRRDVPPARVALVTAAYVATLNVGSLLTTLLTAPIAALIGWPAALFVWSGITLAGVAVWGVHLRRSRTLRDGGERLSGVSPGGAGAGDADAASTITGPLPVGGHGPARRSVFRRPVAWLLTIAFAGQVAIYYALSTWLPSLAADVRALDAAAAGALASIFQGAAIVGAFLVPVLARYAPAVVPALAIGAAWIALVAGVMFAPQLLELWLVLGAVAHAGGFVVIFTALVGISRDDGEAARMSAFVQGVGYALGALGAPLVGWLHEALGGWVAPLAPLLALAVMWAVLMTVATVGLGRDGVRPRRER